MDVRSGYGYDTMMSDCKSLLRKYPFMSAHIVGYSVMGKPMLAIRVGHGPKLIHMNASFHANEWITSALLVRFLDELGSEYAAGTGTRSLYGKTTLWAVPMVNPDGVELSLNGLKDDHPFRKELLEWNGGNLSFDGWKANIRGVDLNDQFPAHWEEEAKRRGVKEPGPRDYSGPYPLSEPESIAMAKLAFNIPFDMMLALHTQGKEIYWNYRGYEPSSTECLANLLGKASGYRPVKLTDSDAGYKDWFIQTFRKPGFTIEAGEGVNPLPFSDFAKIYEEVGPLLLESLRCSP